MCSFKICAFKLFLSVPLRRSCSPMYVCLYVCTYAYVCSFNIYIYILYKYTRTQGVLTQQMNPIHSFFQVLSHTHTHTDTHTHRHRDTRIRTHARIQCVLTQQMYPVHSFFQFAFKFYHTREQCLSMVSQHRPLLLRLDKTLF